MNKNHDMITFLIILVWVIINVLVLRFFSVCDVDKNIDKRDDKEVIK